MVVNLCLPQFQTTIKCNKLCADGYDVTNLLSADPAVRRRGFKLEYFLRPPVQVTLQFGFQVEVCRVDVELWPWGMDRGQACKRLEISTNSDPPLNLKERPEQGLSSVSRMEQQPSHIRRPQHGQGNGQQWEKLPFQQQHDKEATSKGHHWSQQAQQWGQRDQGQGQHQAQHPSQQGGRSQGQTDNNGIQAEFKLVGRCELRDDTPVCFSHPGFRPRPPFASPPPPLPANCREEELWSRGLPSLGSVKQLRVTVPFGGAASALGLKALAVWGLPARCCPPEEVESVRNAHQASLRLQLPPATPNPLEPTQMPIKTTTPASLPDIPEEFLDPLTQEVMSLPMLLPSGVSVDNTTLEEYQKREAGWGRPPNDPFTGVPYTTDSRPLPNPHLKSRIDRLLLQAGLGVREGVVGRQVESPHPSRLVTLKGEGEKEEDQGWKVYPCDPVATESTSHQGVLCVNGGTMTQRRQNILPTGSQEQLRLGKLAGTRTIRVVNESDRTNNLHRLGGERGARSHVRTSKLGIGPKRDRSEDPDPTQSKADSASPGQPDPQVPHSKRSRTDCNSTISSGVSAVSHEQRLSASLDQALLSALQGRPSFTSPSLQNTPASDTQPQTASGEDRCGVCFRPLSAYSTCSPTYRLPCCHFLCRPCLHKRSRPPSLVSSETSKQILCPTCQSPTLSSDITLVHH